MAEDTIAAGVVGVGTMGQHHARVYKELPGVTLVGVTDADETRAQSIADRYNTTVYDRRTLLERCDAVSVAVPTRYHHDAASAAINRGVDVLVEKPFVADRRDGHDLVRQAAEAGVTLQVGHIERFNPAIRKLDEIVDGLDVIAIDVRRLGPPVDRDLRDSAVFDLMIHDIDVLLSITDCDVTDVAATSARDGDHVTAQLTFEDGVVATVTASRVTQEKVRDLAITAGDCRVNVDYERQDVAIHRHSLPEYFESDGDVRYRHESIVERPTIERGEPLRCELEAFVEAVSDGTTPPVTGEDGLEALAVASQIERAASAEQPVVSR
jgi:predicted dehydrogenase